MIPSRPSKVFAPISPPGNTLTSSSEPTPEPSPVRAVPPGHLAEAPGGAPALPVLDTPRGVSECRTPNDFGFDDAKKICPEKPRRPEMKPLLAAVPGSQLSSFAQAFPGLSLPDVSKRNTPPANGVRAAAAAPPD